MVENDHIPTFMAVSGRYEEKNKKKITESSANAALHSSK